MGLCYTGEKPDKEVFEVFQETMRDLMHNDDRVVYLDADLMGSLKTQNLWKEFPGQVFNTGIQEANLVGMACGLFLNGFIPYIHSFSPFASRRVFDQIFVSVAYAEKSVRVIGSDAGIMATLNGGTHMCFEDIALMRTVPGACIVDVSDPHMCGWFLRCTKNRPGLSYIRTPRRDLPDVYTADTEFEEGEGKVLREGDDITLIGSGIMVATCLEASRLLAEEGISAEVIDVVTIKPLDKDLIFNSAEKTGLVITAENASIYGGLGSAVTEFLSEHLPTRVIRIGVDDKLGCVGNEVFLRERYGLSADNIKNRAMDILKGNH